MDKIDKLDIKVSGIQVDLKDLNKEVEQAEKKAEKRFNKVMIALVDIAGQFKKFDEERMILSAHSKDHTDRIGKLEGAVFNAS